MRGRVVVLATVVGGVALGISQPAAARKPPIEEELRGRPDIANWAGPSAVALAIKVPPGAQPAGYQAVPGSPDAILNSDHVGAVGSQFVQECDELPLEVPPGGVAWHFVLPQLAPTGVGDDIFAALTAVFQATGTQTLTTFGPPDAGHAWVITGEDDVLLGAAADVFSTDPIAWSGEGETFDLLHACYVGTDQSTTTAPTTTAATTTASTTTDPATTTSATTDPATTASATTDPATTASATTASATTEQSTTGTTSTTTARSPDSTTLSAGTLPPTSVDPQTDATVASTGSSDEGLWFGLVLIGVGVVAGAMGRRPRLPRTRRVR
jgi:hypothetical protein